MIQTVILVECCSSTNMRTEERIGLHIELMRTI